MQVSKLLLTHCLTAFLHIMDITLRKIEPTDLPWLYKWENDSASWEAGDTHNPLSQKDLLDYIQSSTGDIYKDAQLRLIIDSDSGTAGCVDIYDFDVHNQKAAVAIYIDKDMRKQNIAQKALIKLEEYAFGFLRLRFLYAYVGYKNTASRRLFTACGYKEIATLPHWLINDSLSVFVKLP